MLEPIKKIVPTRIKRGIRSILYSRDMPLPAGPRAFVFLAADYGNIGDLAITAAQQAFLKRAVPTHQIVRVPISATREVIRSIRKQIQPMDLVTTIGGGNMGSLYPDIEALRQLVVRSFPNNRVVCFPQTLDWDDSDDSRGALEQMVRTYAAHPDLHLFARETVSFAKLQAVFGKHASVKIGLVPDIVLSATAEELGAGKCAERKGALLCLRDDGERSLGASERIVLQQALRDAGLEIKATDTHVGGARLASERCAQLLADKLTEFRGARVIVTDRLHGMILSFLAGTPCLALPNSNHKIRQTWGDWLKNQALLEFLEVERFGELSVILNRLLSRRLEPDRPPSACGSHYLELNQALQEGQMSASKASPSRQSGGAA